MKLGKIKYEAVDFLKKGVMLAVSVCMLAIWQCGDLAIRGMIYFTSIASVVVCGALFGMSQIMISASCIAVTALLIKEKVLDKVLNKVWNYDWFLGHDVIMSRCRAIDRAFCKIFKGYGFIRELRDSVNENHLNRLISRGIDVNIQDENGDTPLLIACRRRMSNIAKVLMEMGADVNEKDRFGITPIMYACEQGNASIVKMLIEMGADVNERDKFGITPLMRACKQNDISIVKLLIEMGADVNEKDKFGITPLMRACEQNNVSIVKLLIEMGTDVNEKDRYGKTSLMRACEHKNASIVEMLIGKKADVNEKNMDGKTSLIYACEQGDANIVKMLTRRGAKLEPVLKHFEFLCESYIRASYGDRVGYANMMAVMMDEYLLSNSRKLDSVVKIRSLSNEQVEEGLKAVARLDKTKKLLDEIKCSLKRNRIYSWTIKEKFRNQDNKLICQYVRILTAHKAIRNRANGGDCVSENKSGQNLEVMAQGENKAVLKCVNNTNSHKKSM